jgi:hypothetical protein
VRFFQEFVPGSEDDENPAVVVFLAGDLAGKPDFLPVNTDRLNASRISRQGD